MMPAARIRRVSLSSSRSQRASVRTWDRVKTSWNIGLGLESGELISFNASKRLRRCLMVSVSASVIWVRNKRSVAAEKGNDGGVWLAGEDEGVASSSRLRTR